MLFYHRTSLFQSNAQTIVNTVNCVGVMGKGIAAEFKSRYPDMFSAYKKICDTGKLVPGKLWLWQAPDRWILNFPTKNHWRYPSRLDWIELGLKKFVEEYDVRGITSVSFPRLGCGNGNLDWDDVRPLMEHYLSIPKIPVFIHDFSVDIGLPEHLENLKAKLDLEVEKDGGVVDVVNLFERLIAASHNALVNIDDLEPFSAEVVGGDLILTLKNVSVVVSNEDLKGIWMALSKGPVTYSNANWAAGEGGSQLLSLLSLAPGIRPVQIQKRNHEPEIALERISESVSQTVSVQ